MREKIEEFFKVPEHIADKIQNKAEKLGRGYVLYETRPRYDDPTAPWTKCPIAKITYRKASGSWLLYWCRANGQWLKYEQCDSFNETLQIIKQDKDGWELVKIVPTSYFETTGAILGGAKFIFLQQFFLIFKREKE